MNKSAWTLRKVITSSLDFGPLACNFKTSWSFSSGSPHNQSLRKRHAAAARINSGTAILAAVLTVDWSGQLEARRRSSDTEAIIVASDSGQLGLQIRRVLCSTTGSGIPRRTRS